MSGVKRQIEDKDPDYEEISVLHQSKRLKVDEENARDAIVQKIEAIIKNQFSLEMKNKQHEIEIIAQRLSDAQRMMDKLRACIVANYYANAGQPKISEQVGRADSSVFNHPAIRRFLNSPSRSSSPLNQGSETPSLAQSETESISHLSECILDKEREHFYKDELHKQEQRPGRNVGKDTFGVSPLHDSDQQFAYHTGNEDSLRLYVKKTIVVGNVSKYIPPDKREENDQSTHKWMVYVRGSRKEPSIDHFVKKVWFFLHPSYKPNDLVEVSEPPFHLTRRGWGEFPVRVQIHFKDPRNKRIDIIHHLKLDRTYTGLQTLGAETVVDIELHRHSLGPEYLCNTSQQPSTSYPLHFTSGSNSSNRTSSPVKLTRESLVAAEKGYPIKSETGRSATYLIHTTERTPSRPRMTEKIALGSHGNSAFQPITASCKIVPQSQTPSLMDSPAKSFQPITMSCKIVSGSPTSKPTGISLSSHGARSPVSKLHGSTAGSTGVKVIIKQEPGEVPQQHPQQILASTAASQASPQQFVAVKGGHMIALSPQKQTSTAGGGVTQGKVVGIPVGSSLQSAVKQAVAISGGQILVAKSNVAAAKVIGQKQVIAQGVAKAIVSGASGTIVAQPVQTVTKAQVTSSVTGKPASQGSVMATLQLPANNLSNLASLPPGTKLYLTTNSKNPSGKGKLLLIPQGAILRAANPSGQQAQSANSQSGSSQSTSGGTTQNLSYTSYILKQTPQGTFLVGQQSSQGPAKQISAGTMGPTASSSTGQPQTVRVTAGQKAAILAQVVSSGQTSAVKLSDNSGKTMTVSTQLLKPANTLRVASGLIAASSSVGSAVSTTSTTVSNAQISEGSSTNALTVPSQTGKATVQQAVVVSQNQASVNKNVSPSLVSVAKNAIPSVVAISKTVSPSVACVAKAVSHTVVNVAKAVSPSISSVARTASPSVVSVTKTNSSAMGNAASLTSGSSSMSGKTAPTLSGMLKIHSTLSSAQQAVLTIPANQLKQLGVSTAVGGVQTILMPVNKVVQSQLSNKSNLSIAGNDQSAAAAVSVPTGLAQGVPASSVGQAAVKTEPETVAVSSSIGSSDPQSSGMKVEQDTDVVHDLINTEHLDNIHQLLSAIVEKFPIIVKEKTDESTPFCAMSLEQYYSWNIGKRRAAEWQRAIAVKKVLHEILQKSQKFASITPFKTKQIVTWCRHRGYTPPDTELQGNEENSIEDILTQIDNEPEFPSTYDTADDLCQRLENLQKLLKTEQEPEDEFVDVTGVKEMSNTEIKQEKEEENEEVKFYMGLSPSMEYVRESAEQIGITFQPVELEKNVYGPAVENMILKATEQFASEILREALAVAYEKSPQNKNPKEVTAMNLHQAINSIARCDFLTNKYMGILLKHDHVG
ncbi:YEATS domain-containing protein 2 isoform X1 [Erpetoichthys calabaricus]|uniref:YEATS domain-containing protein 2 isoform X1 n=1 Tax=Erpetoichthys calabaricus TaxID=27687 RepID=UPI00223475AA|nr:YEATS domain-containing protein 2 isoform X1 [Erpetoichthys calabaricus]